VLPNTDVPGQLAVSGRDPTPSIPFTVGACPLCGESKNKRIRLSSCVWWAVLLELPARGHQSTPKCAQIEEAATRKMVLTALAWVKNVNTWFEGSL
jgi:hypothetical protein